MKSFTAGAIVAALLAVLTALLLQNWAAIPAHEAYSTPSARPGPSGLVDARNFSGAEEEE